MNEALRNIGLLAVIAIISLPYLVMIAEPFYARRRVRLSSPASKWSAFKASIIVSAYLPNEHEIIIDSIMHHLNNLKDYRGDVELFVAYNTPYSMPIEKELRALEKENHRLRIIKVAGSNSKAENLNYVLPFTKGDIIALYDADARPYSGALVRAANWLTSGYDFVQGANIISNRSTSLLTRIVAAEFFLKFNLSYLSRFIHGKVTYFCGSNGYWQKKALLPFLFKENAFVEDIDCAIRSSLNGISLAYDPFIMCSELAPPTWGAWWQQRLRWAIGWKQLMHRYQLSVLNSNWSFKKKLYWSFFLLWRRLIIPLATLILPFFLFGSLRSTPLIAIEILLVTLVLIWLASFLQTIAAYPRYNGNVKELLIYGLIFPFYDQLRLATTVVALFVWKSSWAVTPRTAYNPLNDSIAVSYEDEM